MATTETQLNNARTTAARVSSADDNAVANMVEQIGVGLSRLFGAGILLDTDLNGTLSGGTGIAISPGLAILGTAGHELPWPLLSTKTLSFVASPAGAGQLLFVPSTANQILYISRELETDGFPKFVLSGGVYPHPILTFTTGVSTITSVVSNFPAGRINLMSADRTSISATDRQAGFLMSKLLAGTGITLTQGSAGANETLTAALSTPVAVSNGGTGDATLASNGVLLGNGTSAVNVTAAGSANQVLRVPGGGGAPAFGQVDLAQAAAIVNALLVANGGTGLASYTIGDLLYASGATTLAKLADVATGQVLVSGGVGAAPAYSATPTVTTITAKHNHAPDGTQTLAAAATVALTSGKGLIPVAGSGGAISLSSTTPVAAGTAGDELTLVGTSDANTVTVPVNGSSNIKAANGIVNRVLGNFDVLHLVYYNSFWVERGFQNNT